MRQMTSAPLVDLGVSPGFDMTYDIAIDGKHYRLELERSKTAAGLSPRRTSTIEVDAVLARPDVLSLAHRQQSL